MVREEPVKKSSTIIPWSWGETFHWSAILYIQRLLFWPIFFFKKKGDLYETAASCKVSPSCTVFYLTISHSPWITKQTRSDSFRKTYSVSFQENFLEISNTQTRKYNREVSSKFLCHTETNCHYKLLEPLFVAESWPMCPDNIAACFKLQARFC